MRQLLSDIVSERRPAGEMLPREVDLADEFSVSRGVARETIRAMEERGLIAVRHGKGATVTEPDRWNVFDPDVLAALLDSDRGSEVLAQYLECRRILEVEAAGLAAARVTAKQLKVVEAAYSAMENAAAMTGARSEQLFHEADVAFHQALIAATGNQALGVLADRIHSALLLARFPLARPEYREERALPEHRRILDALGDGDPAAARAAMSEHLDTIGTYLREHTKRGREQRRVAA
ncbi:MAG: FadR family transcriptional regulator [Conexibacter sp.]|nr:FadR family transcriptional regulator [Conexibacter sp.]